MGRSPRLFFGFSCSVLNKETKRLSPMEAMHFGGAFHRILQQVLAANLGLWLVYLSKVNLDNAYMRLWLRVGYVQSVAFLVPNKNPASSSLWAFTSPFPWVTLTSSHISVCLPRCYPTLPKKQYPSGMLQANIPWSGQRRPYRRTKQARQRARRMQAGKNPGRAALGCHRKCRRLPRRIHFRNPGRPQGEAANDLAPLQ